MSLFDKLGTLSFPECIAELHYIYFHIKSFLVVTNQPHTT